MEYASLAEIPHYSDCEPIVSGLGYSLVELRIFRTNGTTQVRAVIAHTDPDNPNGIGVNDCAKVHRLLLPRLEVILDNQDIYPYAALQTAARTCSTVSFPGRTTTGAKSS